MKRKFSHLVAIRERACLDRINSMSNIEGKGPTSKDRAELLMYERYRRSK